MTTRGVLNNNPCNIRLSAQLFQGEVTLGTDPDFKQFTSPEMGIRAGAKILVEYHRLHGLSTVSQIISRWAPSSENDTGSYVNDVCRLMAVGSDDTINVCDNVVLGGLVSAIIFHENGVNPYNQDIINSAVALALS